MNILLINFNTLNNKYFPLGIGYITAALHLKGFKVNIFDMSLYENPNNLLHRYVSNNHFDLIGLNGFIGNLSFNPYINAIRMLKSINNKVKIVLGGPMASAIPDILLKLTLADYVIIGEGETAIVSLCENIKNGLPLNGIPGVGYRNNNEIEINYNQQLVKDLDSFQLPSIFHLFPLQTYIDYLNENNQCVPIIASRGCYSKCSFCWITRGKKLSFRSVESIIDEMDFVYKQYSIDRFNFVDDNFLNNPARIVRFCEALLAKNKKYKWRFQARVEKFKEDLVELMVSSGLFGVSFGLESGSQMILSEMKKKVQIEESYNAIKIAKKFKLQIDSSFILGMPSESVHTYNETKQFIVNHLCDDFRYKVFFLIPLPKTYIYEYAKSTGAISNEIEYLKSIGDRFGGPYINLTELSDKTLCDMKKELLSLK